MQISEQNNELKTITISELKQFSVFKNISEQQALELISSLKTLALITHNIISTYEQPKTVSKLCKAEQA